MKVLLHTLALAAATVVTCANAAVVTVTPSDMGAGLNKWHTENVNGGATAAITATNPRNGNGSVEMNLSSNGGKADFVYTWGFDTNRTLGSLNLLSYDWFRSVSSTVADHLHPAFRLSYDADGDVGTTADRGYLIYENVYNGNNVVEGVWRTDNILGANFWMRQFTPSNTVNDYSTTLQEWMNGPAPGAPADSLSAQTAILGVEFGIGSGWGNANFSGFVDNVSIGFGNDATTFNFETSAPANAVPEPGSFALLGLGIVAALGARKRKRA